MIYCNGYLLKIINAQIKNANQNMIVSYSLINLTISFIVVMQENKKTTAQKP